MIPVTLESLQQVRLEAYEIVDQRAKVSAGTSMIPALGVDVAADMAILMELIPSINEKFGLNQTQINGYHPMLKKLIYQLIKRGGVALIGAEITKSLLTQALKRVVGTTITKQTLKFVPVLGWVANGFIGYAAMRYVGRKHVDDCFNVCLKLLEVKDEILVNDIDE